MIVNISERTCTNQGCCLNIADQLSTSDDCINSDKDIESSYEDIKSDNEEVVFIEEQS